MLRVGLTGGLGSGKSTVAGMLRAYGARLLSSDATGRELMQPGQPVFDRIVERFGDGVVLDGGGLDRAALARMAFAGGRVEELNAIVHPAVIAREEELMRQIAAEDAAAAAVVVVESALIFETKSQGGGDWRRRFDRLVLVTAKEEAKVLRFVARSAGTSGLSVEELEEEALRRLALQLPDEQKAAWCDYVLSNDGTLAELQWQVDRLWPLLAEARR